MKHTYEVNGMTCYGCRIQVETLLSGVPGVEKANVSLETERAEVLGNVAIENLRLALPEKYSLSSTDQEPSSRRNRKTKSTLQQLKPLFLILGYILVSSLLLNAPRESWAGMMPDMMGLFFIVFGFFKILDIKGFHASFKMYDPLASRWDGYGKIYPFLETLLGLLFLLRIALPIALVFTILVLGITLIGVTRVLLRKENIRCACLGTALQLPMTKATFIENSVMIALAIAMLLSHEKNTSLLVE